MIEKIVKALEIRGLKQKELEVMAGLSANRISKWKDDIGEPTARQAHRIAVALNVPIGWLCDDSLPLDLPEPLTAREQALLGHVRRMGFDEAERRLYLLPGGASEVLAHETPSVVTTPRSSVNKMGVK